LVSQLVVVLKDTAIGYQITFVELVRQGTVVGSQYGNFLPAMVVIAVLIISANVTLSGVAIWFEQRLRRSRRAPLQAEPIEPEGAPGAPVVQAPLD
jgi:glutamate transport system permease protein